MKLETTRETDRCTAVYIRMMLTALLTLVVLIVVLLCRQSEYARCQEASTAQLKEMLQAQGDTLDSIRQELEQGEGK